MATKKAKQFEPTEEFNAKAAEWMRKSEELNTLKADELRLRNELIAMVYPRGGVPTGTNTHAIAEGWVIKIAGKENYKVAEDEVPEAMARAKEAMEKGEVPPFNFSAAIPFKPQFSKTGYDTLTAEQQHLVDACVERKPGQATVEITKPKRAAT